MNNHNEAFSALVIAVVITLLSAVPSQAGHIIYDKQTGEILVFSPSGAGASAPSDPKYGRMEMDLNLTGDVLEHYKVANGQLVRKSTLVIFPDTAVLWIGVDTEAVFVVTLVDPNGRQIPLSSADIVNVRIERIKGIAIGDTHLSPAYLASDRATIVNGAGTIKVILNDVTGLIYLKVTKAGVLPAVRVIRVDGKPTVVTPFAIEEGE